MDTHSETAKVVYFNMIREREKLSSVWSIFEVDDLDARAPFDTDSILYALHWGNKPITQALPPTPTWLDVWRAADEAIRLSGDVHHIFIEKFSMNKNGYLELFTGS